MGLRPQRPIHDVPAGLWVSGFIKRLNWPVCIYAYVINVNVFIFDGFCNLPIVDGQKMVVGFTGELCLPV